MITPTFDDDLSNVALDLIIKCAAQNSGMRQSMVFSCPTVRWENVVSAIASFAETIEPFSTILANDELKQKLINQTYKLVTDSEWQLDHEFQKLSKRKLDQD
jgi:hypothetical protein